MKISFEPSLYNLYQAHQLVYQHMVSLIDTQHGGVIKSETIGILMQDLLSHEDWCIEFESLKEAQDEVMSFLNSFLGITVSCSSKLFFEDGQLVIKLKEK